MLSIDTAVRRFGTNTVLDGFSLDVSSGTVACLVGPSGCGKSTLLRLVAGLDDLDGGRISVGGTMISSPGWSLAPHKRRLNMVFQDYALWPHMKVRNIVGYGLNRLAPAERDTRVTALLDLMQIGALADRLPSQISGGQQQRVAIARALATDPDLLLFDEPLSNLDVQLRMEMRREFSELFTRLGKTVLYVTHDPLEASAFADTLVVMNRGTIEQVGTPQALFTAPRSAWIAMLAGYDTRIRGEIVREAGPDGYELAVGEHRVRARKGQEGLGGAVTMMLHPARAVLGATGSNVLTGTVTQALFEGHGWRMTIDIGGQSVSIIHPERLPPGEKAAIAFKPEDALVFPL